MIIYMITNQANGKKYIGQTTKSLKQRWVEHNRQTCCRLLSRALKKYGKENFTIEEIAKANSIDELNQLEENLIAQYQTLNPMGYNLLKGGNNKKHHPESCRKMSATRTGKKVPSLSVPRGPRPFIVGFNISEAKKGKPNGLKGLKRPGMIRPMRRKTVSATPLIGGDFILFHSIKEASAFVGKNHSNIVACLKGRKPTAYGYRWNYV